MPHPKILLSALVPTVFSSAFFAHDPNSHRQQKKAPLFSTHDPKSNQPRKRAPIIPQSLLSDYHLHPPFRSADITRFDDFSNTPLTDDFSNIPLTSDLDILPMIEFDKNHPDAKKHFSPSYEYIEDENHVKIKMEVTGSRVRDVKIDVEAGGKVLHIKGTMHKKKGETVYLCHFDKRFMLYEIMDKSHIMANFSDGLLTVVIPKKEIVPMVGGCDEVKEVIVTDERHKEQAHEESIEDYYGAATSWFDYAQHPGVWRTYYLEHVQD